MLLSAIAAGLLVGLAAGGRPENLARHRLHWIGLIFAAVAIRYGTEWALQRGSEAVDPLRLPLFVAAFALLAAALWRNRRQAGLTVVLVGALANGMAILVNGGWMPVWGPSLEAAGLTQGDLATSFHRVLPASLGAEFLVRAGPLADILPIPFYPIQNVASVGDVFIAAGLFWFLVTTLLGRGLEAVEAPGRATAVFETAIGAGQAAEPAAVSRLPRPLAGRLVSFRIRSETGLASAVAAEAATLGRPLVLGGSVATVSSGAAVPTAGVAEAPAGAAAPPMAVRVGRHPYVRLAFNADFSALWLGNLVSLFGDRVHQVALAVLVYQLTGSELGVGLVFLAATAPNLLVGPIAGTLVDRWGTKKVMVASDLLRGALVLLLPLAAARDVALVYPLVFAVTSVSMFFRPARFAAIPRIVRRDELPAANSLSWIGESIADIAGYPLAGLLVAFLAGALPLAFWFDSASYVISAALILTISIPPLARRATGTGGAAAGGPGAAWRRFREDLAGGWRFLRGERALFANTLISVVGQLSVGATLALTVVYARDVLDGRLIAYPANYAALDGAIGLGNLVGGFAIGLLGARVRKGRLVVTGYVAMGLCTVALAATGNVLAALALMFGVGVGNMAFVIPTQTLFQERTPEVLIGRVVGFRFSVVFGAITLAMGVSGWLATIIGVTGVFALFGAFTVAAGLVGLLVPAVRDA